MAYGTTTIEDLLRFSVADLKRLGYIQPGRAVEGVLTWFGVDGRPTAEIRVTFDANPDAPAMRLRFNCDGRPVDYWTRLVFMPSRLNRGGYYMFVCPVTGRNCRKLYFVGGRFVSRFAFRALYEKQTQSRAQRKAMRDYLELIDRIDQIQSARYRKETYRGKPTPYGRHVEKVTGQLTRVMEENRREVAKEHEQEQAGEKIADFGALWD